MGSNVDIVIPWVDDSDPKWQEERAKYLGDFHEKKSHLAHYFRDWDTLRFVFRSIEKNMPWIRHVHFITCGHYPKWMNLEAEKLKFHKHSDFFEDASVLPVFSSRPIEMNLMNIPALAEKFVYFNDDTIVTRPVNEDRFFSGNRPYDFLKLDFPRGGRLYNLIRIKEPYAQTLRNAIHLIRKVHSLNELYRINKDYFLSSSYPKTARIKNRFFHFLRVYEWITPNHNPQPYFLSDLRDCKSLFASEMQEVCKHRFRDYSDLNQYLFRYFTLMSGRFIPRDFQDGFCMVLASLEAYHRNRHYLFEKNFCCLNDSPFLSEAEYPSLREVIIHDLESIFPEKSSFEL